MNIQLTALLDSEIDPVFTLRSQAIFSEIEKRKPKLVLDAGCGRGFYSATLTTFPFIKKIVGIDLNNEYLKIARKQFTDPRLKLGKASIYSLPFQDNSFDAIICSEVLEHVDDNRALQELQRVVKKDGVILITVPSHNFPFLWDPVNWILMKFFHTHINKNIWWLAGMWADHERLYTVEQLKKVVAENSLKLKKIQGFGHHCWPFSHFVLYGIGKNLVERLGIKSFYRFNFERKPLSEVLASIFRWPLRFDKGDLLDQSCVDLFIVVEKKSS